MCRWIATSMRWLRVPTLGEVRRRGLLCACACAFGGMSGDSKALTVPLARRATGTGSWAHRNEGGPGLQYCQSAQARPRVLLCVCAPIRRPARGFLLASHLILRLAWQTFCVRTSAVLVAAPHLVRHAVRRVTSRVWQWQWHGQDRREECGLMCKNLERVVAETKQRVHVFVCFVLTCLATRPPIPSKATQRNVVWATFGLWSEPWADLNLNRSWIRQIRDSFQRVPCTVLCCSILFRSPRPKAKQRAPSQPVDGRASSILQTTSPGLFVTSKASALFVGLANAAVCEDEATLAVPASLTQDSSVVLSRGWAGGWGAPPTASQAERKRRKAHRSATGQTDRGSGMSRRGLSSLVLVLVSSRLVWSRCSTAAAQLNWHGSVAGRVL